MLSSSLISNMLVRIESESSVGELDGRRVLVVEDDLMVRLLLVEDLVGAGCIVTEAIDGAEALDILTGEAVNGGEALDSFADVTGFDLVVTGIHMPCVDGWTLAERVRALRPGIAVLYVTATDDAAARSVPGSELLKKPFRRVQLVTSAARAMKAHDAAWLRRSRAC